MRFFVTGASGSIGSAVTRDLLQAGHQVLGLARSDTGAKALAAMGAEVRRGDLADPQGLAEAARECDGVAHLAFIHDFSKYQENVEIDRRAAEAMLGALEGTGKPFVLTSGVGMLMPGRVATEQDMPRRGGPFSERGATEYVVLDAARRGVRACVIRVPQVHGPHDHGFTWILVQTARRVGFASYIGDGANRWPAVHRLDLARLYRLALEKAEPGAVLHGVGEEGVALRDIADGIGEGLGAPVRSISAEEAGEVFGWFAPMAAMDSPASSAITRETLGWTPVGPTLLTDLRTQDYFREAEPA